MTRPIPTSFKNERIIVVLGATGQQGGATARALVADGWRVRALVRDPSSAKAKALAELGVEILRGDLRDRGSIAAAIHGAYGVFSVQPSSGQPEYGITDADETRIGKSVVDVAREAGVEHLVYTSVAGVVPNAGVGHFESKWAIEEHARSSGVRATIVRPCAFMEILFWPAFGAARGTLVFFGRPDRRFQLIAADDIGKIAAHVFADPDSHAGKTFELAGDSLTGDEIAARISRASGTTIAYAQFPAEILEQNPALARLVELVDKGGVAGNADIAALRRLHPSLMTFDTWLDTAGAAHIEELRRGRAR